jgi:hypothetical protein
MIHHRRCNHRSRVKSVRGLTRSNRYKHSVKLCRIEVPGTPRSPFYGGVRGFDASRQRLRATTSPLKARRNEKFTGAIQNPAVILRHLPPTPLKTGFILRRPPSRRPTLGLGRNGVIRSVSNTGFGCDDDQRESHPAPSRPNAASTTASPALHLAKPKSRAPYRLPSRSDHASEGTFKGAIAFRPRLRGRP